MSLPTLSGTARLVDDVELRFSPSGVAVAKVRLAFNSRRLNKQTQQWEDGDTFFVNGTLFNQAAENAAESLTRATEVVVTGRLKTDQWETKDGEKRSGPSLLIDSIGPAVNNFQTAKAQKLDRQSGGTQGSSGGQRQTVDDPWSSAAPAAGGSFDSEPPF